MATSRHSSVVNKSYSLVFIIWSVFLALCCGMYYYIVREEKQLYINEKAQFTNEIDALIDLSDQTNIANLTDIAYWDETIEFIQTKDQEWFTHNVVYAMDTYDADYMAIYDKQGNLVRKNATAKISSHDFLPRAAFEKVRKERLTKFYIKLPEGYLQVFAASIHPTRDVQVRQTVAEGFFCIGKLIDENYFAQLEAISNSDVFISLHEADATLADTLRLHSALPSFRGDVLAYLSFQRPFNVSYGITKLVIIGLIVMYLLSVVVYFYMTNVWIFRPLRLVAEILEKEKVEDLRKLLHSSDEFRHIGKLIRDHAEQKNLLAEAKVRAEESDRLKSSFLTNISHEIRTPMNAISGFSELLLSGKITDLERQDYIKIINSSGRNLVSIIDDLIEMSKIDTNQVIPNYGPLDLDVAMAELHQSIKITIPSDKKIDFILATPSVSMSSKIITDGVKLKQVMTNLIMNAIKYTESGFVRIGYHADEEAEILKFRIDDSGIGIDEQHQSKVFERFHRVENDVTIKAGGLGLGLAITKAYVRMLGGSIDFRSELNKGTTFEVTLPLRYADFPRPAATILPQSPAIPLTILVAEDDNINYLLIHKLLTMCQHKVLRAKDGREAVTIALTNSNLDLVLMDIKMPVLNGYDALAMIRSQRPTLPVVAQTAYASAEDERKILHYGFSAYISKPINKEKLCDILSRLTATTACEQVK